MKINKKKLQGKGIKYFVMEKDREIGRAYLYILKNDLHKEPFGFIEDVFVEEDQRGQGIGSVLINVILKEAEKKNCYKLIMTSRHSKPHLHKLYQDLGFNDHGKEFRVNF